MKKIALISTGGTIVCTQSGHGLAPGKGTDALLEAIAQTKKQCNIDILPTFTIDSTNISIEHWKTIGTVIMDNLPLYDGFVVTHGTDTMAYTCAALFFMLGAFPKPVILTGSQLPLRTPGGDAENNLYHSITAAISSLAGVYLQFSGKLIRGDCAKKVFTKSFDAFWSINQPVAASITEGKINIQHPPKSHGALRFLPYFDEKVILLKITPGFDPSIIEYLTQKCYHGIVIEGFGTGSVPCSGENSLIMALSSAVKKGILVALATQCLYDGMDMDTYEVGKLAKEVGILSCGMMTAETAFIKLMWSLGSSSTIDEARNRFLSDF